jgi:hypothetical protein
MTTTGYIAYWFWDLSSALRGTIKVENAHRFCAHFLLSLDSDNHGPLHLAVFIRDICSKVRKRTSFGAEIDDIAFRISSGFISGYIQWRTPCLRDIQEWIPQHASLWLTDLHGPVHFETNSSVIGHHTMKAFHTIIQDAVEYVSHPLLQCLLKLNNPSQDNLPIQPEVGSPFSQWVAQI